MVRSFGRSYGVARGRARSMLQVGSRWLQTCRRHQQPGPGLRSERRVLRTFGDTGDTEGLLQRPTDAVVAEDGSTYVVDFGHDRFTVFREGNESSVPRWTPSRGDRSEWRV